MKINVYFSELEMGGRGEEILNKVDKHLHVHFKKIYMTHELEYSLRRKIQCQVNC